MDHPLPPKKILKCCKKDEASIYLPFLETEAAARSYLNWSEALNPFLLLSLYVSDVFVKILVAILSSASISISQDLFTTGRGCGVTKHKLIPWDQTLLGDVHYVLFSWRRDGATALQNVVLCSLDDGLLYSLYTILFTNIALV